MASRSWLERVLARAKEGLTRPAPYGPDIDISNYADFGKGGELDLSKVEEVGVNLSASALYIQVDQSYFKYISRIPGVEVMPVEELVEERPEEAQSYLWRLVDPAMDKYTALAALRGRGGYFIRVKRGAKVEEPIMACLFMSFGGLQAPHNVVVLEEGSEATVYTGCAIAPEVLGLHVGISEFYVAPRAKLRFVMVHSWNRVAHVRPRTVVEVSEGGEYVSYYVNMSRVKSLQTYPKFYLSSNAKAYAASVVLGLGDADVDVGSMAVLEGEGSAAELVSRFVARDSSRMVARATVEGRGGRGHIDCRGLMLSEGASIITVPELRAFTPNTALTHEASIGRLAEDEINYLVSKGFSREEAVGILVRGFVTIEIKGVPERVRSYIETVERLVAERAL